MSKISYVTGRDAVQFRIDGNHMTIPISHPNYTSIIAALDEGDIDKVRPLLVSVKQYVADASDGEVVYDRVTNSLMFEGEPLRLPIVGRIVSLLRDGYDVRPMFKFLRNILDNPSARAREELYNFMEVNNLPVTPDGYFIAYKMVRNDFKDIYTGSMDNSPGSVVKMKRSDVNPDKNQTCSHGLHFAALEYVRNGGYGSRDGGSRLLAVKINPRDVVAIPTDYNNSKGRACQYLILRELDWDSTLPINTVGFPVFNEHLEPEVEANTGDTSSGNFTRKWSDAEVRDVKRQLAAEVSLAAISRDSGMSRRLVARIRDGEAYADVLI